jgi:multicomponent Na+:H+ antiporter subunit D
MTTSPLPALTIAVPLLAAALLTATQSIRLRYLGDAIALAAATASTTICALDLALAIRHREAVYWFGGWQPRHGVALGISFAIDPFGAGLACFCGVLTIAALIFSWRHFELVGHAFPALMLVFMTAMMGFCLSGDLFNMFVFFELMTVSAIALTAHRADERAPLQGALGLGITNSIAGFIVLFGIALLYGRTGALNLAQIGATLSQRPPDGLVVIAFALLVCGFFVKAAIAPFHFWLADAYASAPTPVCVLFAGVMSELGLYAVARLYWTVFAGPLGPHAATLRLILVVAGTLTALLGSVMCLVQEHLKRLLAFATISYMGLFLIGLGLLNTEGLAGAAIYVIADGLVKASLFLCVGILQHRRADGEAPGMRGRGRGLPYTGGVFALGILGLAALPGWGAFLGRSAIEDAATKAGGYSWVAIVFTATEVLIAAAAVAAAARVFLGWGPAAGDEPGVRAAGDGQAGGGYVGGEAVGDRESGDGEAGDDDRPLRRTPVLLFAPAVVLALCSLAVGIAPGVSRLALDGAQRFVATPAYLAAGLGARPAALAAAGVIPSPSVADIAYGVLFTAVAVLIGLGVLVPRRLPDPLSAVTAVARQAARRLHALHSGHPGDYITWLTLGAAVFTGVFAVTLR